MKKTVIKINASKPVQQKTKLKVAAYCRVSCLKDAMLYSLSNQVSYYSVLVQKNSSWEYVGVYADEAITGTKEERPEFVRMIDDCKSGKINMVITKSISRFARNIVTLLNTIRELKAIGVDVYFEEENIHSISNEGELLLTILAAYAQEESRSVSENQKWRIRKNFESGLPWSYTILGYKNNNGEYEIVEEEAKIVRLIFDEYTAGKSLRDIVHLLNQKGCKTKLGKLWCKTSVRNILKNYTYTGNLLLQKTYIENHLTKKKMLNDGHLPKYHVEDSHEPIIPISQFEKVQAELQRRAETYCQAGGNRKKYPFSGLIVCGNCGSKYRRKTTKKRAVWICSTYNDKGKKYCSSKQIPEDILYSVLDEEQIAIENIDYIEAFDGNTLKLFMKDLTQRELIWKDYSRADSWTPEMKEEARIKSNERLKA